MARRKKHRKRRRGIDDGAPSVREGHPYEESLGSVGCRLCGQHDTADIHHARRYRKRRKPDPSSLPFHGPLPISVHIVRLNPSPPECFDDATVEVMVEAPNAGGFESRIGQYCQVCGDNRARAIRRSLLLNPKEPL